MKRSVLNLQQGSPEWLAARAASDGTASEAPAMKGKSKYQTRTSLLDQRKTGLAKEVDAHTQAIFNKGHEAEAKARLIAEEIIGQELSPVTYMIEVDGLKLMASLDGITFDDSVIWEHKLWNESLAEQVRNKQLDEHYTIQLDQELLASNADKCLFMVSDGTRDKCVYMWYETTGEKISEVVEGWKQFKSDLVNHVPTVKVQKVEAEEVKALPVPSVVVRGEITASNLNEITPKFDAYLSNIKTELATDQDFADAEANAKNCRETAKRIEALQENIIGQMVSVNEVNSVLENYKIAFNKIGLQLEKAVKEQKESLKTTAIMQAKVEYADFVSTLNNGIDVMLSRNLVCPDFASAIKGVKTIASMHSRINDALAAGKTEATTLANDVKTKLAYINETAKGYEHLINVHDLAFADIDYIKLFLSKIKSDEDSRKAEYEASIKAKAEADAKAKVEAEAKAAADKAEADHLASDHKQIPEGDGITNNVINEADFNKIFEVKEQATRTVNPAISITKHPTLVELVDCVATAYRVDSDTAYEWLVTEFSKQAKAA